MTAIRELPLGWIVLTSLIGGSMPKLLHLSLPETGFPPLVVYSAIFGGLFAIQAGLFAIYAIIVYPLFLSPFRHLHSPKGGIPFFGHGRDIRIYGPGHMARLWYCKTYPSRLASIWECANQFAGTLKPKMTASCVSSGTETRR